MGIIYSHIYIMGLLFIWFTIKTKNESQSIKMNLLWAKKNLYDTDVCGRGKTYYTIS